MLCPAHCTCVIDKCVNLQRELIGSVEEDDCEGEESVDVEPMWHAPIPLSLADVPWLVHEFGEPGIRIRFVIW